jgi:hypothetical protein
MVANNPTSTGQLLRSIFTKAALQLASDEGIQHTGPVRIPETVSSAGLCSCATARPVPPSANDIPGGRMRTRSYASCFAALAAVFLCVSVSVCGQAAPDTQRNREVIRKHLDLINRGEWRQAADTSRKMCNITANREPC